MWHITFNPTGRKDFTKLDPPQHTRIDRFLHDRLASLENPRCTGEDIANPRIGYLWRWKFGNYRILGNIDDKGQTITIHKVRHRREVYD